MTARCEQRGDARACHGDVATQSKKENRNDVEDLTYNEKALQIQEAAEISFSMGGLHLLRECSRKVKKEYTENWKVKKEWTPMNSVQSTSGVLLFVYVE
jgi:hypothetical protein